MKSKWAYAFPDGTATVGFDAVSETGTVQITPAGGNITVAFAEVGTVTTGWEFDVDVSHDGVNFANYATGVTDITGTAGDKVVIQGPFEAVKVTCRTFPGGTGDVIATVGWTVSSE